MSANALIITVQMTIGLTAGTCRIEHDHALLADCEGHWKARELLQQVIDNAIDEMTLHRKRVSRPSTCQTRCKILTVWINRLPSSREGQITGDTMAVEEADPQQAEAAMALAAEQEDGRGEAVAAAEAVPVADQGPQMGATAEDLSEARGGQLHKLDLMMARPYPRRE